MMYVHAVGCKAGSHNCLTVLCNDSKPAAGHTTLLHVQCYQSTVAYMFGCTVSLQYVAHCTVNPQCMFDRTVSSHQAMQQCCMFDCTVNSQDMPDCTVNSQYKLDCVVNLQYCTTI